MNKQPERFFLCGYRSGIKIGHLMFPCLTCLCVMSWSRICMISTCRDGYANKSRMARNYVAIVQNILRNVSRGEFPGDYLTASVKNQGEKRKVSPQYPARSGKRGVSQKRYQEVKKRDDPMDPYK